MFDIVELYENLYTVKEIVTIENGRRIVNFTVYNLSDNSIVEKCEDEQTAWQAMDQWIENRISNALYTQWAKTHNMLKTAYGRFFSAWAKTA